MSTDSGQWPRTLTSGLLAGRTFWSDRAYRQALGEARLEQTLQNSARQQLEALIAAHDEATAAEQRAIDAREDFETHMSRATKRLADAALQ